MKVIKRDGSTVDFDRVKIANAIRKANAAVDADERISEAEIEKIVCYIEEKNRPRLLVEDIQDMVETSLMKAKKYTLAKAYIIYRYTRALVRMANTTDEPILNIIENGKNSIPSASGKTPDIADAEYDGAMCVRIKKLNEKATVPAYASEFAAGADLYASLEGDVVIDPGETVFVHTGIVIEIPEGYAGLVYARSGLASKRSLAPANKVGVIDSDYRGEVMVALHNHGKVPQTVSDGERIAQLVISPVLRAKFSLSDELSDTARGEGGFGSTGKK